jgi:hypothetical protein
MKRTQRDWDEQREPGEFEGRHGPHRARRSRNGRPGSDPGYGRNGDHRPGDEGWDARGGFESDEISERSRSRYETEPGFGSRSRDPYAGQGYGQRRGESAGHSGFGETGGEQDFGSAGFGEPAFRYTEVWLIEGPHTGRGPKGYKRSDERLREQVCERLERHGRVDASEIDVKVEDGVVTLEGQVDDRRAKRLAEECAESVYGVQDVMNRLKVNAGFFQRLLGTDDSEHSRDHSRDRESAGQRSTRRR